jgi:hypothetical protein
MAIQRRSASFNGPVIGPVKQPGLPGPPDFGSEAPLQRQEVNDAVAKLLQPAPEQSVARAKALSSPVLQRFWGMDWDWLYEGFEQLTAKQQAPAKAQAKGFEQESKSSKGFEQESKSSKGSKQQSKSSKGSKQQSKSSKGSKQQSKSSKGSKQQSKSSKGSKQPSKSKGKQASKEPPFVWWRKVADAEQDGLGYW